MYCDVIFIEREVQLLSTLFNLLNTSVLKGKTAPQMQIRFLACRYYVLIAIGTQEQISVSWSSVSQVTAGFR